MATFQCSAGRDNPTLHQGCQRFVHGQHSELPACLHLRVNLVSLRFSNQVPHRLGCDQDFGRDSAPLSIFSLQQLLCDYTLQGTRQLYANLLLLERGKDVDNSVDGLRSILSVKRSKHEVAGFRVVHLPGHAPGLIALIRERDGVALTSDSFYTIDSWWRRCPPYTPGPAWSWDVDQARRSLRRLATLDISIAWPGHGEPITGDVAAKLSAAARR